MLAAHFRIGMMMLLLFGSVGGATLVAADGSLTRIGDARIAMEVIGNSGPVVVFESGLEENMSSWNQVAPSLAVCARLVLYDRPGNGRSSPRSRPGPVLASAEADRLAELLKVIGARSPYILVGHSLGGLYVQSFARRYPQDVAAVVLVDAASPLEPPGVFVSTVPARSGSTAEAEEAGVAASVAAMLAGPGFPPVPLIVLAATDHGDTPEREALWRDVQGRTAALSPRGRLDIVHGGHFIQKDQPQAVIRAVLEAAHAAGADVSRCRP